MTWNPVTLWKRLRCRLNKHRFALERAGQHWAFSCIWCSFYRTWSPATRWIYLRGKVR